MKQGNVTRRNFLAGSAAAAALAGLAGCSAGPSGEKDAASSLPSADQYPIDPDGSDVQAKWTSEETRDGWTRYTNPDGGAELGVMDTSKVIQVDGLAFKDMNGNGKLDLYEDWRQSGADRAAALAEQLSAEEILPLMFHNGMMSATAPLDDDSIVLWMEFELLYNKHLEQDVAVMQRVRSDEERQYQLSKDTIDAINVKCHDIRHQIRHLEEGGVAVEKGALEDLAQEVRIYDSKVKTGNDALDTILSEKRLLCEREGTRLTCIADGAALSGLSPADLYSLFGNLLDNAIEAVRRLDGAERRTISLVVSRRGDMAVIHEENYFDGDVRFEGGLPVSTKGDPLNHGFGTRSMSQIVERYGGSMSMRAQGDRFGVTIVLPA